MQKDNKGDGGNEPRTFMMTFPEKAVPRTFPVEECNGRAATWTDMWVNLWHHHVWETMVIL